MHSEAVRSVATVKILLYIVIKIDTWSFFDVQKQRVAQSGNDE